MIRHTETTKIPIALNEHGLCALARSFVSLRAVYQLGARWYGPSFFSCTRAVFEDLPGERFRQTAAGEASKHV